MERWKKPHHDNLTGRECGGGARGLAGLPQAGAKVLEGYFSSWGFLLRGMGPKPQAGLPSLHHQNRERNQNNIQLWQNSGVSTHQGDTESLLKGQRTKFCLQLLTLGAGRGRAEWTTGAWGESGASGSGERTEGTATRMPVLSHSPILQEPSFSGRALPSKWQQPEGKQ